MEFLFRADANPAMGTGHVMRCLALDYGTSAFYCHEAAIYHYSKRHSLRPSEEAAQIL